MDRRVFDTYQELCVNLHDEIRRALRRNPALMLCIAAGHTSNGLLDLLADTYQAGQIDFAKAAFVAMDEWLGMNRDTPGSCGDYLQKRFLAKVNFPEDRVWLFDGAQPDPEAECRAAEAFIERESASRAIDFLVLGAGMNGHLALNEPGTPFERRAHAAALDPVTREVGQKYFARQTELRGGVTLGIANFRQAGRSILMLSGAHKQDILAKIINGPVCEEVPATAVRTFDNASLYCDADAAKGILR